MIFIVGNSRSGTTMLGRVLARNSRIHTFGELHFFEHQVDGATVRDRPVWPEDQAIVLVERLLTSARDGFFAPVTSGRYLSDARAILSRVECMDPVAIYAAFLQFETERHGKCIPCEQTPRYLFFAEDILEAFPNARIINMVRDPRDVLISQKGKWKRRFLGGGNIPVREAVRAWANYHPLLIARLWVSCVRHGIHLGADARVKTIRFEDLLQNPETVIRDLSQFVDVPFELEMLRVPHVGSSSGADKPDQLGINASRAGGWREGGLSKTEMAICEWIANKEMVMLGYGPVANSMFSLRILPSIFLLLIKLAIALPMNLSRTKNLRDTIRRRLFAGRSA